MHQRYSNVLGPSCYHAEKKYDGINLWLIKYPPFIPHGQGVFVTTFVASGQPSMCDSGEEANQPSVQQLKSQFPDIMSPYKGARTYVNTPIKMVRFKELETGRIKRTSLKDQRKLLNLPRRPWCHFTSEFVVGPVASDDLLHRFLRAHFDPGVKDG